MNLRPDRDNKLGQLHALQIASLSRSSLPSLSRLYTAYIPGKRHTPPWRLFTTATSPLPPFLTVIIASDRGRSAEREKTFYVNRLRVSPDARVSSVIGTFLKPSHIAFPPSLFSPRPATSIHPIMDKRHARMLEELLLVPGNGECDGTSRLGLARTGRVNPGEVGLKGVSRLARWHNHSPAGRTDV